MLPSLGPSRLGPHFFFSWKKPHPAWRLHPVRLRLLRHRRLPPLLTLRRRFVEVVSGAVMRECARCRDDLHWRTWRTLDSWDILRPSGDEDAQSR